MKLFVLLICCISVFYVGYLFTKLYQKKLLIFYDLLNLCEVLENNIKFKKDIIAKIITDNKSMFSKEFNLLLEEYYFKTKSNSVINYYLSNKEKEIITNLFNSLGKYDVDGELKNINGNKVIIKSHYLQLSEKNNKEGMLGVKLGTLSALLILIIFI